MLNEIISPLYTIGIPTFNRHLKLERLLDILERQINQANLHSFVEVLISDNASTDNTSQVVEYYRTKFKNLKYICNNRNIGYDLNVLSVYNNSSGDYVWLFADDDIPLEGTLLLIYNTLKSNLFDIVLYSFAQPPGTKIGAFNFEDKLYITNDYSEVIELILRWKKISIYILRRINFTQSKLKVIYEFIGQGWCHVVLALSILDEIEMNSELAVISNILAECDDEFDVLTWTPEPILNSHKLALHPIVKKINPNLSKIIEKKCYLETIQFCFAAKRGTLRVEDIVAYDKFIKNLHFKFYFLYNQPMFFFKYLLLKLQLVPSSNFKTFI